MVIGIRGFEIGSSGIRELVKPEWLKPARSEKRNQNFASMPLKRSLLLIINMLLFNNLPSTTFRSLSYCGSLEVANAFTHVLILSLVFITYDKIAG